MGFAENLGVIINMKDAHSPVEADYQRWLNENPDNQLFAQTVPRTSALQHASHLSPVERSYMAKYPGEFERRHPRRVPGAAEPARRRQRQRGERIRGVVSSGGVGGVFLSRFGEQWLSPGATLVAAAFFALVLPVLAFQRRSAPPPAPVVPT